MIRPDPSPEQLLEEISDLMLDIADIDPMLKCEFLENIDQTLYYCEKYINELIDLEEEND